MEKPNISIDAFNKRLQVTYLKEHPQLPGEGIGKPAVEMRKKILEDGQQVAIKTRIELAGVLEILWAMSRSYYAFDRSLAAKGGQVQNQKLPAPWPAKNLPPESELNQITHGVVANC